ncbi:hypothetical protein J6590_016338 [Homalodisca vitripennis]|nr:hypothetical protein J6590_016338 [Homalodisca vitripennis]
MKHQSVDGKQMSLTKLLVLTLVQLMPLPIWNDLSVSKMWQQGVCSWTDARSLLNHKARTCIQSSSDVIVASGAAGETVVASSSLSRTGRGSGLGLQGVVCQSNSNITSRN